MEDREGRKKEREGYKKWEGKKATARERKNGKEREMKIKEKLTEMGEKTGKVCINITCALHVYYSSGTFVLTFT